MLTVPYSTQWILPYISVGVFIIIASAVGLGPFSGYLSPPMYGDFEAQRHWLEITTALSTNQWYFYDLEWWGLDYPPLTAYHSYILGKLGLFLEPKWFELDTSRGAGSRCSSASCTSLKAYMRFTVILSQLLLYVPFVYQYAKQRAFRRQIPCQMWVEDFLNFLLAPSLLIIDNGHFQYNSVMLGLFVACLVYKNTPLKSAAYFTCALLFKQMALFWAPVVFFYILGRNPIYTRKGFRQVVLVGITVLGVLAAALMPWIASPQQLLQIVHRVFPFARGLWEDKVANFWCVTNTLFKYKDRFDASELQKMATSATLVSIVPSCFAAYFCGSSSKLAIAFACCSWAFYLFGFQVHEKSVLVPLIPTSLLMFEGNPEWSAMVQWINNIAYFSMWPLLRREGLYLQYFVLLLLWNYRLKIPSRWLNKLVVVGSYGGVLVLWVAELFELVPLAKGYPDLWTLLNCTLSFGCFSYVFIWLNVQLYSTTESQRGV